MRAKLTSLTAGFLTAAFALSSASAQSGCGICDAEVVINSDLATCFLEKYQELAGKAEPAVLVDLSECAESRGIVAPIPGPNTEADAPTTQFMLSREQLDCLKQKLEEPGLVLDPSARIDLGTCG